VRPPTLRQPAGALELARLRRAVSAAAGRPLVGTLLSDRAARRFVDRPALVAAARRGPLTPDHALVTRRRPLVVDSKLSPEGVVERYASAARAEFSRLARGREIPAIDPAPRLALVPGTGIVAFGETPALAARAAEIATHTAWAIERAEALGGYRPLSPARVFEVEHWPSERAKLPSRRTLAPLAGRVALVTGSASGIGRATAEALLAAGAAVVGLDLAPSELDGAFAPVVGDAASLRVVSRAIELAARSFGGLDIVVANAGIFFAGPRLVELADADWRRTLAVNLDAPLRLLRAAAALLAESPVGGSVVVVGSKNVAAPGRGAAAYSASKAALTQLARVAALEWAPDGVRVNVVHPDAVFDTGVWTADRLAERARNYGLSVEEYKRRNLLGREVRAADVAAVVVALAGDLFAATTGAQIPIDGGNERVI